MEGRQSGAGTEVRRLHYPNGALKGEVSYRGPVLHGPSKFYSEEGKLLSVSEFADGRPEGKCERRYPSGAIYSREYFQNGLRHGRQEFYYEDGGLKTEMECVQGRPSGAVRLYSPDGTLEREVKLS